LGYLDKNVWYAAMVLRVLACDHSYLAEPQAARSAAQQRRDERKIRRAIINAP
jgi:hypothetical protein